MCIVSKRTGLASNVIPLWERDKMDWGVQYYVYIIHSVYNDNQGGFFRSLKTLFKTLHPYEIQYSRL